MFGWKDLKSHNIISDMFQNIFIIPWLSELSFFATALLADLLKAIGGGKDFT
jgi:hypothetical protein